MKIAIPTNDGLSLCSEFGQAKGFLVLDVEFGEITREELRWTAAADSPVSPDNQLRPISDCQAVIANQIGQSFSNQLDLEHKTLIRTAETIITNAYVHYLESTYRKAADTCCCP